VPLFRSILRDQTGGSEARSQAPLGTAGRTRSGNWPIGIAVRLDFFPRPELQMRPMAARGEVRVKVSFGLTSSPVLAHAVSYAIEHASATEELRSRLWEATFRIDADERVYGELLHLLRLVGSWKTTRVEVDASVESRQTVISMLGCAREWLRTDGRAGPGFPRPGVHHDAGYVLYMTPPTRVSSGCSRGPSSSRGASRMRSPTTSPRSGRTPRGTARRRRAPHPAACSAARGNKGRA